MASAERSDIERGSVLGGKYRIEAQIGKGGMAVVFAARHVELGQRVAIKVLPKGHLEDAELVTRFMREARAAVRLRSEHAVKIFDVGKQDTGAPYIVMELLEGEDLGRLVARGPIPVAVAVECIMQACEAVAEAHTLGIVHRDLKPANLFLRDRELRRPFVKVLDFGLAKHLDPMAGGLTATTAVFGSPDYMSPEQLRSSRDVDGQTDIWSLGVCLYELIAGRTPFAGNTVAEVCAAVLKQAPVSIHRYAPGVPAELWSAIERCLQKDTALRYADVSAFALAIERFAPVHAAGSAARIANVLRVRAPDASSRGRRATSSTRDAAARVRNARWLLAISGVLVLCGLFATLAVLLEADRPRTRLRDASDARVPTVYSPEVVGITVRQTELAETKTESGASASGGATLPTTTTTPTARRDPDASPPVREPPPPLKIGPSQRL